MIRSNGVLVPTRQAYIETFTQDFAHQLSVTCRRTPDKVDVSAEAPLAAEHSKWVGSGPDGTLAHGGTYLAMWRKTAAGWKLRFDLYVVLSCGNKDACAAYRGHDTAVSGLHSSDLPAGTA